MSLQGFGVLRLSQKTHTVLHLINFSLTINAVAPCLWSTVEIWNGNGYTCARDFHIYTDSR